MWKLLAQITAAVLALFLADKFISGVSLEIIPGQSRILGFQLTEFWQILLLTGAALGIFNFFLKPILKTAALPLRIITFGLFSLVINIFIVWLLDRFFSELTIQGFLALFETSLIVWLASFVLPKLMPIPKNNK